MKRLLACVAVLFLAVGCAQFEVEKTSPDGAPAASTRDDRIALFSDNPATGLPRQWDPLVLFRTKKRTHYQLVSENGKTVLHAIAAASTSGLMQNVNIDPMQQPWLNWQWKIGGLVDTSDRDTRATEDSPGRIILGFDGDKDKLPFSDLILFETARVFTGYDFPYATLMYIWDAKAPIGTILTSKRSGRIKMLVVANGTAGVGQWQVFTRNIVADFESAYGEKPGRMIGVGVLTDTDTSGETVETWYGDIRLQGASD
jgi:hypothetical protein